MADCLSGFHENVVVEGRGSPGIKGGNMSKNAHQEGIIAPVHVFHPSTKRANAAVAVEEELHALGKITFWCFLSLSYLVIGECVVSFSLQR